MNPSAALQSTVEDFLDSLKETPGAAQAELVNCILRAWDCNETINEGEVVDYDGVVDALDNFTEALKQRRRRQTILPQCIQSSPDAALRTLHQYDMARPNTVKWTGTLREQRRNHLQYESADADIHLL